jgi:hypothetical protein
MVSRALSPSFRPGLARGPALLARSRPAIVSGTSGRWRRCYGIVTGRVNARCAREARREREQKRGGARRQASAGCNSRIRAAAVRDNVASDGRSVFMTEEGKQEQPRSAHMPEAWRHLKAAGEEIRKSVESMVPPESRDHSRAAGREALLAARSVIDAAIARLEGPRTA